VVLGLAIGAKPHSVGRPARPVRPGTLRAGRAVRVGRGVRAGCGGGGGGLVRFGHDPPARVAGDRLVSGVAFEVGGGGIEEKKIHFEVEQGRDLPEHLLLQLWRDLDQPVHRPVAGVVGGLGQPVDVHVAAHPPGRGKLGGGVQGPVGDQREQHPLDPGVAPAPDQQLGHQRVQPQPPPQPVQHVGATQRAGLAHRQPGITGRTRPARARAGGVEQP